ncbi:MAG: Glyoxalase-like domain protein [Bacteroidetes bacterium ADurb.Bin141]|nr:VOC family protein [Bacteroidia bacterium]MCE7956089.1 lactoylglutathione lyase [Bacteroidetes bacterium CHB6]OQB63798.1 MAG: Glyoxalase-like domain protein [Bacteroidetes bacterium ADurb.Bin141]
MVNSFIKTQFILYVRDQQASTEFYSKILRLQPSLNVPGMTEFILNEYCKLGLMPENGIAKILSVNTPHPAEGNGVPRCELYLNVENTEKEFNHSLQHGAKMISAPADRDWGDKVCYLADPDGHIIAFAEKL